MQYYTTVSEYLLAHPFSYAVVAGDFPSTVIKINTNPLFVCFFKVLNVPGGILLSYAQFLIPSLEFLLVTVASGFLLCQGNGE